MPTYQESITNLPLATKHNIQGRNSGQKRIYKRWTIDGHDGYWTPRFETSKDNGPLDGDVHARYHTKAGDRSASFLPAEPVPDN
jgi:hypothetical protein